MKILAVMNHQGNAGNTHAIANYIRVAPTYGHSVAIYGAGYGLVPELQFSTDVERFDRVLYLCESERHRISPLREAAILAKFPRRHRLIQTWTACIILWSISMGTISTIGARPTSFNGSTTSMLWEKG